MPIRVAIIEDHPLMLKAIVRELSDQADLLVVGTAPHGSELHRLVSETSPDVVVLDLGMSTGKFDPISAVKAVRQAYPDVQIMVLTGYEDKLWVRELIAAGVRGYVLKSDDLSLCLPQGIRQVHRGSRFYSPTVTDKYFAYQDIASDLTAQELEILRLAAQGLSNAQIGQELGLAEKTVRNYFSSLYSKLNIQADKNVNPRVSVINVARELGLFPKD
jgi:DNA-binding NarL/FixJ family response regulator